MIAKTTIPILACALLCACQPDPLPDEETPTPDTTAELGRVPMAGTSTPAASNEPDPAGCGADGLGAYLNLLPTQDVKDAIAQAVGERPIRYIEPDQPITADFRPERLNVETGVDGRIKHFRCG